MELDTFYEVIVPAHMDKQLNIGRPGYYEDAGFLRGYRYVPPTPATWEPVMVSEKHYIFEQRKKAKKFCLEHDYPISYIHERKC